MMSRSMPSSSPVVLLMKARDASAAVLQSFWKSLTSKYLLPESVPV
jgi:hypothetical protein